MEEFAKLDWGDDEVNELGEFLDEDDFKQTYCYKGLQLTSENEEAQEKKNDLNQPINTISKRKKKLQMFMTDNKLYQGKLNCNQFKKLPQSSMGKSIHKRCLVALDIKQSGKSFNTLDEQEKLCWQTYLENRPNIAKENIKFLNIAQGEWITYVQCKSNVILPPHEAKQEYLKRCFEKQNAIKLYPTFYKKIIDICLDCNDNHNIVDMIFMDNVLLLGSVGKFTKPSTNTSTIISPYWHVQINPKNYPSKLPVSKDPNVEKIVSESLVDVVIAMSSLKLLIDNEDLTKEWDIPVTIKNHQVKIDTTTINKRVIYFDKPIYKRSFSAKEQQRKMLRKVVKWYLCKYKAFDFPTQEGEIHSKEIPGCKEYEHFPEKSPVHHNVTYSLWNIRFSDDHNLMMKNTSGDNIKVLIRSKIDGCVQTAQSNFQPVVVEPKLELQLKFGGAIYTKSELLQNWISLYARPYSILNCIRMDGYTHECVVVEEFDVGSVRNMLANQNIKPSSRLGALRKIFADVKEVSQTGSYLLVHKDGAGPFATFMTQCTKNESTYDAYKSFNRKRRTSEWSPIDCEMVLEWHKTHQRMPGLFLPRPKSKKLSSAKRRAQNKAASKPNVENTTNDESTEQLALDC